MKTKLIIAGMGPGDPAQVPRALLELVREVDHVLVPTRKHPAVVVLEEIKTVASGDRFFDQAKTCAEAYRALADWVVGVAQTGDVIYAVPGHPMVAEATVPLVLNKAREMGIPTQVLPAQSFLDGLWATLQIDTCAGVEIVSADRLAGAGNVLTGRMVVQIHDRKTAAQVKLSLQKSGYPAEHMVTLVRGAGIPGEERIETMPLALVDHCPWIDHLTSLWVPPLSVGQAQRVGAAVTELAKVVAALRGEHGCPWDREQTHLSLRQYLVEECYEVIDAIEAADLYKVQEELGDLLLQIVLHSQIASEAGNFTLVEVAAGVTEKMIRRHPHVFGDVGVTGTQDVLVNWERIKKGERHSAGEEYESILDGIPSYLPALMQAKKMQQKAARVGFDWADLHGALAKLVEESAELEEAVLEENQEALEHELGDLLFSVVNLARLLDIEPEGALRSASNRFKRRFMHIEKRARENGQPLEAMSLAQMDAYWDEAKAGECKK
jgi:tetrapyrrole methylase family protein/MazG family protein